MVLNGAKHLILKSVTLLASLGQQRSREFLPLIILDNIAITDLWIITTDYSMNTSNRLFYNGELKFPVYPEDQSICAAFRIRDYTKKIIQHHKKFFLSFVIQGHIFKMAEASIIGSRY